MTNYTLKGKVALVTGAGSGIGHATTELLLKAGCSVMLADLNLRPEAESTLNAYAHSTSQPGAPSALFQKTDVTNWAQIQSLWDKTLEDFGRVDIVASVAGVYEPPWSSFWNAPGISAESRDPADATVGQYSTIAVNYVAPVRLAQIAIDYWTQHREIEGNFLAVASLAGYLHSIETPLYMSSKAGLISFVKSMGALRDICGIRFAALCPGAVLTPIFEPEWNKKVTEDDVTLSPHECAEVLLRVLQEPQWGNGNIVETQKVGSKDSFEIDVRGVHMEALYPKLFGRPSERSKRNLLASFLAIGARAFSQPYTPQPPPYRPTELPHTAT